MKAPRSPKRGTWSRPISISPPPKRRQPISPPPKRRQVAKVIEEIVSSPDSSPIPCVIPLPLQRGFVEQESSHNNNNNNNNNNNVNAEQTVTTPELRSVSCVIPSPNAEETNAITGSQPLSHVVPSPFQLNFIKQLPSTSNVDAVSLGSILGDVMIRECWLFNYLFDLDFVMKQFDADVRDLIKIRVIHGSWKKEDLNRIKIDQAARRYSNIDVITAYMPEAFGTHHTKMIVLFRHDNLAQVIVLTGNLIERDWTMSQAIWHSPLLPLRTQMPPSPSVVSPRGSGLRFKRDLMAYLRAYGTKLEDLTAQLADYDFGEIRAAFIASTPGKQNLRSTDPDIETLWGLPGLKNILCDIPSRPPIHPNPESADKYNPQPHIIIQVSSIASVGEKWLSSNFLPTLSTIKSNPTQQPKPHPAKHSIIFPTPSNIRNSIDGYSAGASIHMKIQSAAQATQLAALRPMLCRWGGELGPSRSTISTSTTTEPPATAVPIRSAGRHRAAPHIKTYVRFSDASHTTIDWAMVTSANLSTQAWGSAASAVGGGGEVRICSYEVGVVVWPGLWDEGGVRAKMVPWFGEDGTSGEREVERRGKGEKESEEGEVKKGEGGEKKRHVEELEDGSEVGGEGEKERIVVGFRMPYDLPLVPYEEGEMPWCATMPCLEPDWRGGVWKGYGKK